MDMPSGSWIVDPVTGELTPDMNDQAMRARYGAEKNEGKKEDKNEEVTGDVYK